jgi:hypothetical protein
MRWSMSASTAVRATAAATAHGLHAAPIAERTASSAMEAIACRDAVEMAWRAAVQPAGSERAGTAGSR